jgi:uncharacterized protein (UPF0333 family)
MKNKGQTAMEYLMTYGWAILIIIVVVAALYAMGVFKLGGTVGCSPCFSYFAFVDYSQDAGSLRIRNGARTVTIAVADVTGGTLTTTCDAATPCQPGDNIDITGIATASGTAPIISITYIDVSSSLQHTDAATLHNK